jgi:glucosamine--fructose-6-phosphate aminotransferase (isomerizing)
MCGIVGYVGPKPVAEVLIEGLRKLEYRGYDSAGIAVVMDGKLDVRRCAGKLKNLEDILARQPLLGTFGIAHTRWATHGRPTDENAHPHRDCDGKVVVIHNGIIENFMELKRELLAEGHKFATETDTEIIAHLIEKYMDGRPLEEAVRAALPRLGGVYALAVIATSDPGKIVAARLGPPLIIGVGEGENFVASDIPAVLVHTRNVIFLADGEMAIATKDKVLIQDAKGNERVATVQRISWDPLQAEKGGYRHFMLKEIHEQPSAVRETLNGRLSLERGIVEPDPMPGLSNETLAKIERVCLVACGTSWHASLAGKFLLEHLARIPTEVDYGSEYRYRQPIVDDKTLHVVVTQSGETADTLAALREAKRHGAKTLAICNVVGSMATREADGTIYTHAGPEIGVASTKAFTCQLVALYILALHMGRLRGTLSAEKHAEHVAHLAHLPALLEKVLRQEPAVEALARKFFKATDFLYLGRGINYPVALEGALKLKEISYIHAEGYPAGEMKHGPIALIDENMPVVTLAPKDSVYDKIVSNIEQVKARLGIVIALTTEGNQDLDGKADDVVFVPKSGEFVAPVLLSVPLQLLAYHIALLRGCDVDQPRNLAKSVTVE